MAGWSDIPEAGRLGIAIGVPVILIVAFGWMTNKALIELGPDPALDGLSFLQDKKNKKSLWKQIEGTRAQIAVQEQKAEELPALRDELAAKEKLNRELKVQLPTDAQKEVMRQLLQEMMTIPANIGKVQYEGMTITEAGGKSGRRGGGGAATTVTYRCNFQADMNGLIYFINRVEKSPRFMAVEQMRLQPGAVTVDTRAQKISRGLHRIDLEIVTYVLPEES